MMRATLFFARLFILRVFLGAFGFFPKIATEDRRAAKIVPGEKRRNDLSKTGNFTFERPSFRPGGKFDVESLQKNYEKYFAAK